MQSKYNVTDLILMFNGLFQESEHTILLGGHPEPLYSPKDSTSLYNRIYFREDYYSSALHEVAHWCIAGSVRRKLADYGYWYQPDGRQAEEQHLFEKVEARPQAIEWIFSAAAGSKFSVSADNLNGQTAGTEAFRRVIYHHAITYLQQGLPTRAEIFKNALLQFYKQPSVLINY